ncbi:hypothetical protein CH274_15620 [Rhodococcus sp. 06-418-5]|uniref:helix-turn-helix domain-containing protein n=1 Tax=Rhodococcus sp. 06-418-5 TaxID=2022507 RepID=UPI000BD94312|nr:helix-turn-helix transcriptional regulator [Rhodococcus sp. 06-418-5]OZC80597.1 hypothetical protein CH274_15620 [Rhodococcus sp. 06-418-5]
MTVLDMPDRSSARGRVAAEVRAEAARAGVSQNRLAQLTGLSQSNLSRKMKALRPFDIDELEAIATVLGVDVASFFGGTQKDPRPDGDPNGGLNVRHQGFEPRTR